MKKAVKKIKQDTITYDEISSRDSVLIKYCSGSYSIVFREGTMFTTLIVNDAFEPDYGFNRLKQFLTGETIADLLNQLDFLISDVYVFKTKGELFRYLAEICDEET